MQAHQQTNRFRNDWDSFRSIRVPVTRFSWGIQERMAPGHKPRLCERYGVEKLSACCAGGRTLSGNY